MSEAAYSNRSKEEIEDAEILSEQALQEITDKAVEDVESIKSEQLRQNSEYSSSGFKNQNSFQHSNEYQQSENDSTQRDVERGSPINVEGGEWSLNDREEEEYRDKVGNMSDRDKEILEEFRNVRTEEQEAYNQMKERQRRQEENDFRTGSFKQGEDQQYYSEAFSFSKDQVDPDTYPEHDVHHGGSPREYEGEMDEYHNENYVSMGDRDIDIGELSGFQQLKMKNQMMLSTSQIINYHRYVEKRAKKVFSSLLRGYSPVN